MSDSQSPETKPGPPNPQAEGVEAPSPPGGPLRQDEPDTAGQRPGGHDDEASASPAADKHASEAGGHTIPLEDEQPGPGPDEQPAQGGDTLQFENAETSLDQPSEG